MVTVEEAEADYAEVGGHVLTVTDGHVQYDEIWKCENCGAERTHAQYFAEFECEQ